MCVITSTTSDSPLRLFQGKEAVDYINSLIPAGSTVSSGYSTTLQQIGYVDAVKARKDVDDVKGKAIAAMAAGDHAGYAKLVRQGAAADFFLSSVSAITADGNIHSADKTGSRIAGWFSAGQLIVVAGTNKIVENDAEALQRLLDYQVKLESARCRVAYGVPGSSVMKGGPPCA